MIFAIDFDGTCVTNNFPNLGEDIGADIVIRELLNLGHKVFIYTMRGHGFKDYNGNTLREDCIEPVKRWLSSHGLTEVLINEAPDPQDWTDSPKLFAHYYIDDMALGAPLMYVKGQHVINWVTICNLLHLAGVLSYEKCIEIKHKLPYGH